MRGALLRMYREELARTGDPVDAWAAIVEDPEKAQAYKSQRGLGGFLRSSWDEVSEIIAAAHVHTTKQYGPDRIVGFSPIPAMCTVSYAAGTRFLSLIGGVSPVVLRLVRRPAAGLAADLGRPDRRPRVRRLVELELPDALGLERPADAHAGRALHDRGALPRPEGRRRLARLRRPHEVRRPLARRRARDRRGARAWRWPT